VVKNPGNVVFNTPGIYLASLTAIDKLGNTEPDPPTRQITVLPKTPDFSITVTPPAAQVLPGQSAPFKVTIVPLRGFNSIVSLKVGIESHLATGISSGGFSPAQINRTGTSTLTMKTTAATVPYGVSLTVTGTSGSLIHTLKHTASTTLLINLAPPAVLKATAFASRVSLAWTATGGASGYHVKRSKIAGGPYISIGCSTRNSFIDTKVVPDTTYHYVVAADYTGGPNGGGESAASSEASATVN
jgi:hypothetical protein